MAKSKQQPVLYLTGSDTFRVRRIVNQMVSVAQKDGWKIERPEEPDADMLSGLLASTGLFMQERIFCIIRDPKSVPLKVIHAQLATPNPNVVLLLVHEGATGKNKVLKQLAKIIPKAFQQHIEAAPAWEVETEALKFVNEECKRLGITMDDRFKKPIIQKCGTDLGVLSWEMRKLKWIQPEGSVSAEDIRSATSSLQETPVSNLIDAILTLKAKRILKATQAIRNSHSGDPTMSVATGLLSYQALRWFAAISFHEAGVPASVAAAEMKSNSWYWENKVLPGAKVLGKRRLVVLTKTIRDAQVAVTSGHIDPWSVLECGLVRLVQPVPTL